MVDNDTAVSKGFTIVELLIVVVVVAILAAIVTVGYRGVSNRAQVSALESDVSNAQKQLLATAVSNGVSVGVLAWNSLSGTNTPQSVRPSNGAIIDVVVNGDDYCIRAYKPGTDYSTAYTARSKGSNEDACVLLAPSVTVGGPSSNNLVGWWKLNGNADDSSGLNHESVLVGTPLPTTGQNGRTNGAFEFAGLLNQYISVNSFNHGVLTPSAQGSSWTISAWVAGGTGGERMIAGRSGCHGGLYTRSSTYQFAVKTNISGNCWTSVGEAIGGNYDSSWHHLVGVYQAGALSIYMDGSLRGVGVLAAPMYSYSSSLFVIGGVAGSSSYGHVGKIDDVRVYTRALSTDEVSAMFVNGAM